MQRYGKSMKVTSSILSATPLTNDQLLQHVPSVLAEGKHEARSAGYTYVPTIDVIDRLRQEGFQPFYAAQSGTRDETRTGYTRHIVRLRHPDHVSRKEANEVVLMNSHDGTSSYQLMAGIFVWLCANGIYVGDMVQDVRIPHRGNIVDNVIEGSYQILSSFDLVDEHKDEMKSIRLSDYDRLAFARSALALRYDNVDEAPIEATSLLSTFRMEEREPTLWNTFNVVQENMIRGKVPARTKTGKRTQTRAVNSIQESVKLNKALWLLASAMTSLKQPEAA